MGAAYGKKKAYDVSRQPKGAKAGKPASGRAASSSSSFEAAPGDGRQGDEELVKPKKLLNPVKESRSHQELHRELLGSCRRSGETKTELQKVLESRKRDQLIRQRKQEEEARRKISPLEAELMKRQRKLDEMERQAERQRTDDLKAPEFVRVREKLRRTSFADKDEKEA